MPGISHHRRNGALRTHDIPAVRMRILVPTLLLGLTACTAHQAPPSDAVLTVTGGSNLQFRKVASTIPPGPVTGAPGLSRQSTNAAEQTAAAQSLDCAQGNPASVDVKAVPTLPLVGCNPFDSSRVVLDPAFMTGTEADTVAAALENGQWVLNLAFKAEGARIFGDFTGRNVNEQVAIVVGDRVLSAPSIQSAILDGHVQITGKFTEADAVGLAHAIAGS